MNNFLKQLTGNPLLGITEKAILEKALNILMQGTGTTPQAAFNAGELSYIVPIKGKYQGHCILDFDNGEIQKGIDARTCQPIPQDDYLEGFL